MDKLTIATWKIGQIAGYIDSSSSESKLIEIPRFQRGIVWGRAKIERLVDSLFQSFPIGSLLAFDAGSENGKQKYQLVDGLQRANAIAKFTKSPLTYASPENLFPVEIFETLTKVLELKEQDDFQAAKDLINNWLTTVEDTESREFLYTNLRDHLTQGEPEIEQRLRAHEKDLERALASVRQRLQDVLNSGIPVLIYEGSDEEIPEIFERINSQGTQLSKYDILASSWVRTHTHIKNPDILEAIKDKYRSWESEGFEVQEDILGDAGEIGNLYEYLMGFSKVISQKFPILFGPDGDSEDIAFQIFTVVSGLPVSKMRELPGRLIRDSEDFIEPGTYEVAILSACDAISKRLAGFVSIRGNKTVGETKPAHSQNQIISLITSLTVSAYDLSSGKLSDSSAYNNILANLPSHYLRDILNKSWKGSGDSRLFDRTWMKNEKGLAFKPDHFYQGEIYREGLEGAFTQWNQEQMQKEQTSRPNLQKDVVLLLKFLYSGIMTVLHDQSESFEIEHIYPVSYCSRLIAESDDNGWPISAIGNLMLLPKPINRIKGEKLLGPEVERLLSKGKLDTDEKDRIAGYLLEPSVDEVVADVVADKDSYLEFCERRSKAIFEKLCQNLKLRSGNFNKN